MSFIGYLTFCFRKGSEDVTPEIFDNPSYIWAVLSVIYHHLFEKVVRGVTRETFYNPLCFEQNFSVNLLPHLKVISG